MNRTPAVHDDGEPPGLTLAQFETVLARRSAPSQAQSDRLRRLPAEVLAEEVRAAAGILRRLAEVVATAARDPARATGYLEVLDLRLVTRDHDWRAIFAQLRERSGDGGFERAALRGYLAYLCSRRELLEQVLTDRRALEGTDEVPAVPLATMSAGLRRLPPGEAVVLELPYRGTLALHLGRHAFTLLDGCPPRLVDPDGDALRLQHGRQLVGRHPSCELVIPAVFRDVSRAHLLIEWDGSARIVLIDRSTLGTFVQPHGPDDAVPLAAPHRPPCAAARADTGARASRRSEDLTTG